jgi:hypothetical protein
MVAKGTQAQPDGVVARVIPKASPKAHDEVVPEALGELAEAS